jgi:hypothetical protein
MIAIYARMCYCKPLHGVTVTDIIGIQAKLALQYSALTDLYVLVVSQILSRIGYAYLYTPFMCSALRRFPYLLRTNPPRAPPETPPKTSPGTGGALKATATPSRCCLVPQRCELLGIPFHVVSQIPQTALRHLIV